MRYQFYRLFNILDDYNREPLSIEIITMSRPLLQVPERLKLMVPFCQNQSQTFVVSGDFLKHSKCVICYRSK